MSTDNANNDLSAVYTSRLLHDYKNYKTSYENGQNKIGKQTRHEEDLEDYKERETNIMFFALIALFSCVVASFVLWIHPSTENSTGRNFSRFV